VAHELNRRNFLRLGLGASFGIATAGTLSACGIGSAGSSDAPAAGTGKVGGDIRLAWWGSDTRHQRTNKVLEMFKAKYPDAVPKGEFGGFQGYFDKLATQTAGGNAPDAFQILNEYLPEYAGRGALTDLTPYVGKSLNLGDFAKPTIDGGRVKGKLVGISFGDNIPAIYYDKTKVEALGLKTPQPGYTWDDLVSLGGEISKKSGGAYYGTYDFSGTSYALETWLRQRGKELYTEDGKLAFAKSDLAEWFTFWDDLRKQKICVPADVTALFKGNNADIPMMKGLAANFVNYPNLLPGLQAATKSELVLTTYPKAKDQKRPGAFVRAANWIAVYEKSANRDTAVALADFLVNDVEAGKVLGVDRGAPPSTKVRDAVKPTLAAPEKAFLDYVALASQEVTPQTIAQPKGAGTVYTELQKAAEEIGFGKAGIAEGVDRFFAEAERAIR
jgi:multiple sugar transport system substrate-binding protein